MNDTTLEECAGKIEENAKEITRASELVGGTYLTVELIQQMNMTGKQKIKEAKVETIPKEDTPDQSKIGLTFEANEGMILILNKTNTKTLIKSYGDLFAKWTGKEVELSVIKVPYMGKMVDSIHIEPIAETKPIPVTGEEKEAEPIPVTGEEKEAEPIPVPGEEKEAEPIPVTGEEKEAEPIPVPGEEKEAEPIPVTGEEKDGKKEYN